MTKRDKDGKLVFVLPPYNPPPYGQWVTNASCDNTLNKYQNKPGYKIGPPISTPWITVESLEKAGICGVYRTMKEKVIICPDQSEIQETENILANYTIVHKNNEQIVVEVHDSYDAVEEITNLMNKFGICCMVEIGVNSYENNICPDCDEPIPTEAVIGQECPNCGHVWW